VQVGRLKKKGSTTEDYEEVISNQLDEFIAA
jgi:hypothetical protein